jgi:hypothetical protein
MTRITRTVLVGTAVVSGALAARAVEAGVRKEIQAEYVQRYKNKAMFLKVPVRGMRQAVLLGDPVRLDRSSASQPLNFKVGEQVRIVGLEFGDSTIHFRLSSVDLTREADLLFTFPAQIGNDFPERKLFEAGLTAVFTEGLSYTEIDSAKESFIKGQFDDLIQQFATSTNATPDFVIKTISEKNPEYRAAKDEAREAKARLQEAEGQLRGEARARKEAESELQNVRRELAQTKSNLGSTRDERSQLLTERMSLQSQVTQLQARNQEYERQVNDLLRGMGIDTDTKTNLGKRVEAASRSFDSLRSERSGLSQKLSQVTRELDNLRSANNRLKDELQAVEKENAKLTSDLRALTSDRKSVQARYLRTRRQKEVLENAAWLEKSLRVERRREEREEAVFDTADIYLLSKKIAVLETQVPEHPGASFRATFAPLSPDTVQFTEPERRLYGLLGDKLRVEASWVSPTKRLQAKLTGGKPLQQVAPREQATWTWDVAGELDEPERLVLVVQLHDRESQLIPLLQQEAWVTPGGVLYGLKRSFSGWWLGLGVVLGVGLLGTALGVKGPGFGAARRSTAVKPGFVAQKKL